VGQRAARVGGDLDEFLDGGQLGLVTQKRRRGLKQTRYD